MPISKTSDHQLSRRNFLGAAATVPLLGAMAANGLSQFLPTTAAAESSERTKPAPQVGIELYSVRGELGKDLHTTLKTVAEIGYKVVEFYSPYYSWPYPKAKDVRSMLDDLGLRCFSTHNGFQALAAGDGIAKGIELNQILGARHIILASAPGTAKGMDGWKKLCEQLTAAVQTLIPHGLTAGFHNHQTEWKVLEGDKRIMDVLAENTPREFVLQLDVGTCVEAGADPVAWIKSHPGRIKSIHAKDWAPANHTGADKGYRVLFNEGVCPWKEILAACESVGGTEFYLIEQEGSRFSEFETAKKCLENWQKFRHSA